jgi:protein O-mannosyl-transferase
VDTNVSSLRSCISIRAVTRLFERRDWQWGLLLVALVFIAYVPVYRAGFIWDDESHLTQNPCVIGPLGLKEIWTSTRAVYYPLVLTSFWAIHKFAGLHPLPYHILNVSLHVASAVLLWGVLRQLRVPGAWLGAALWALHPVMVQSVAWITELKNTQSCLFYLLSILFFLKWEEQPRPGSGGFETNSFSSSPSSSLSRIGSIEGEEENEDERMTRIQRTEAPIYQRYPRHPWFILSLFFFILATLSKPSVVMLPAVLALCVWWRRGRIRWQDAAPLAPYVVISAIASAWTIWEQRFHAGAVGPDWEQTWPERLVIAGRAIWFYLGKLLWPHPLIFIYPRWEIHASDLTAYLPLAGAILGLVLLWFVRGKAGRAVFFAASYYVVSLFPVLGFFTVYFFRYSFVSDHFQYLASMGPLALAGAGIAILVGRFFETPTESASDIDDLESSGDSIAPRTFLTPVLCSVLLVALGFLTWRQTIEYRDLTTLYTSTLAKNPGCWMAHYNLGIVLRDQGQTDQAVSHYRQAVALRPHYTEAHYNLARLLAEKREFKDAIAHYEAALTINPEDAEAHNNLGATLFEAGMVEDAIAHYTKAVAIRPDYAEASCNLATALLSKGDIDGAIARYLPCLESLPNQPDAQYNLASALLRRGRIDEAITHYEKALGLLPENPDAHVNLGSALLAKGRLQDAIAEYRSALRVAPKNTAAQSNLAWLLATSPDASLRNGPEAVLLAEEASQRSGGTKPFILRILAAAYAEAGRFNEAKDTANKALQAADSQGNFGLSKMLRTDIALYESGRANHREPQ